MATITYTALFSNSYNDYLSDDEADTKFQVNKAGTRISLYDRDGGTDTPSRFLLTGTGLAFHDSGAVEGILSSYTAYGPGGQTVFKISDLSLDLSRLEAVDTRAGLRSVLLSGNDRFNGSSAGDTIWTGAGNDTVNGGRGDDYILDAGGRDTYDGGADYDTLDYSRGGLVSSRLSGITVDLLKGTVVGPDSRVDTVKSIEEVIGTMKADKFYGTTRAVVEENFVGLAGNDSFNGRSGDADRVSYNKDASYGGTAGVRVYLYNHKAIDGFGDTDRLYNIDEVRGTAKADRLYGDSGWNYLRGDGGNDILKGMGGGDLLEGGTGNDTLYGTAGSEDRFRFQDRDNGSLGTDTIKTFRDGEDRIIFRDIDDVDRFRDLSLAQTGSHVTITYDLGKIIVENITVSKLTAADFDFL